MQKKSMYVIVGVAIVIGGIYSIIMAGDFGNQFGAARQSLVKGFSVSLDSSSPPSALLTGGSQDVTVTTFKVQSSVNEDLSLRQLAFQFNGSNPAALTNFTVWRGDTRVGMGVFPGGSATTTVVFSSSVTIPREGIVILALKAVLAPVGVGQPARAGDAIAINYDGQGWRESQAVGLSSGVSMVSATRKDTKAPQFMVFKSVPAVTAMPVFAPPLNGTTNISGTFALHRFAISASPSGDIGIGKLTFKLKTSSGVRVNNLKLWVFSDQSFSLPYPDLTEVTRKGSTVEVYFKDAAGIPAGVTRFFQLMGDVTRKKQGGEISVLLEGDKKFSGAGTFAAVDGYREDDFIWSDGSTGFVGTFDAEHWSNGYAISGLPSAGLPAFLTDEPSSPITHSLTGKTTLSGSGCPPPDPGRTLLSGSVCPPAPDVLALNTRCEGIIVNVPNGVLAELNWSRVKDATSYRIRVNDLSSDDPPRVSDNNCPDMRTGDFCTNWGAGAPNDVSYRYATIKDHPYEWFLQACSASGCSDPVKAPKTFVCHGEITPESLNQPPGSVIK